MTASRRVLYSREVEDSIPPAEASIGSAHSLEVEIGNQLRPRPATSRIDRSAEDAALAWVRRGMRDEALKLLMTAYGARLHAFAVRVLRDRELAKDVRQQVFLEAFQGIGRFEGRSSLWGWLCGIAYHRCLDELRRQKRSGALDDIDVLDVLDAHGDVTLDPERMAKYRALEHCLAALSPALRAQVLMRHCFDMSFLEIAKTVGDAHGTIQVRVARILPRLRRCLSSEGITR